MSGQTSGRSASVGAARDRRAGEAVIVLRDGGTEITMRIPEPLAVGQIVLDDPSASYPPEHTPPIEVRETSPDDSDLGAFRGSVTIAELADDTLILRFDLTLYLANQPPTRLYGETPMLALVACS